MLCRLRWRRGSDEFGLGVTEEALEEGEKRMGIILKQEVRKCTKWQQPFVLIVNCVNYTTLLLAAADPRGPTS